MSSRCRPWLQARTREALLHGAALVVADEAHVLKNEASNNCRAMRMLRTRRRLALTGYPLQNNLEEYYQMISWVRHACLGICGRMRACLLGRASLCVLVPPLAKRAFCDSFIVMCDAARPHAAHTWALSEALMYRPHRAAFARCMSAS